MQDLTDKTVSVSKFTNCKFIVIGTNKYRVYAENKDGSTQPICLVDTTCSYMNHALAITIAEALRQYYERKLERL